MLSKTTFSSFTKPSALFAIAALMMTHNGVIAWGGGIFALGIFGSDRYELEVTIGTACHAMAHFEMDCEWRYFLAEHAGTETGHGWGYMRQANAIDPSRDYSKADPEFERKYGLTRGSSTIRS